MDLGAAKLHRLKKKKKKKGEKSQRGKIHVALRSVEIKR